MRVMDDLVQLLADDIFLFLEAEHAQEGRVTARRVAPLVDRIESVGSGIQQERKVGFASLKIAFDLAALFDID